MPSPAKKHPSRANLDSTKERLEARVSADQKLFFQRAAALKGVTLTDFMIDSLQSAAVLIVEEHDVIRLTLQDKRRFVDALMNPPTPNEALKRAVTRYTRMQDRS